MNIKEFINWRNNCFFCGEELRMLLDIGGISSNFKLIDDWLRIESTYLRISINIFDGRINNDNMATDVFHAFLNKSIIKLHCYCRGCDHKIYTYTSILKPVIGCTEIYPLQLKEVINIKFKYLLKQSLNDKAELYILSTNKDIYGLPRYGEAIKLPYLNLFQITPFQFENKIKTYILFS